VGAGLKGRQTFARVSAEFREAATALLGVKLTFFLGRVVRVTSLLDVRSSFVFGPRASLLPLCG
jgi:hypothetical protein